MIKVNNFQDVATLLSDYRRPHGDYVLDRILAIMEKLGNPQNSYKVIHIAGTSGKSSTAYYTAALLAETGKKVGLTVSPHVDEINERIQINLKALTEAEFCSELTIFLEDIESIKLEPSYFELLIAFAYWEFARQKVDYAVVEVGLGGLLDSTNVISRADKVSVITDIGLDHTQVLGKKLSGIAAQKAGIILPKSVAFTNKQSDEVMTVFRSVADSKKAQLFVINDHKKLSLLSDLPLFQRRNWSLAYAVFEYICKRDKLTELTDQQLLETTHTHIPARMEVLNYKGKTLIIDGAHNQQKLRTLTTSILDKFPNTKIAVELGLLEEKDDELHEALKEITNFAGHIITTSFFAGQDIPKKAMGADEMERIIRQSGYTGVESINDPKLAFEALMDRPEDVVLVTGSFYLLNNIRPIVFLDNKK